MISVKGIKVTPTTFPDKTTQVWRLPEDLLQEIWKEGVCTIDWEFESEAELLHVAQLKTLLDTYCRFINLNAPYLPYARQDKRVDNNSTFALKTFATLLNALNFNEVHVLDAHNNLQARQIERLEDTSAKKFIEDVLEKTCADVILYPDAGAKLRYGAYQFTVEKSIYADKVRDQSSGFIKSVTINGKVKRKKVLIIDDIADGGKTFELLAEQARKDGADAVYLYVTHGLFTKGLAPLQKAGIDRFFTREGELNIKECLSKNRFMPILYPMVGGA